MVRHEEVDATVTKCFVGLAGIEAIAAKEIKVAATVLTNVKRLAAVRIKVVATKGIKVADRTEYS
jgi:hypothetical protein